MTVHPPYNAAWQTTDAVRVDSNLVARLHRVVGEALTDAHETARSARGRPLSDEDERALSHALLGNELRRLAEEAYGAGREPLDDVGEQAVMTAVLDRLHGLARLQPLLDDPEVRDIHVSGHARTWVKLRDGTKLPGPAIADSDEELIELIATWARRLGRSERRWDYAHPSLNMQLPNGDRLHALMGVSGRPTITIRRHDFSLNRLAQLVELGLCDDVMARFLSAAVRAKLNLIVAGGTGTGKTTTLRCLINEIPPYERLITIEDSLEIGLDRFEDLHPDYEMLEAREPNTEGVGEFSMARLVREALRMDPERVIVGEVRGAEVLPMLLAMGQGNDGSMCSIHADSSRGAFGRMAMYAAMTEQRLDPTVTNLLVAGTIKLIVHIEWVNGVRRITSIREVTGTVDGDLVASNELWRPGPDGIGLPAAPPTEKIAVKLSAHGFAIEELAAGNGWWR